MNRRCPDTSWAWPGSEALPSELRIWTASVTVVTVFQDASHARTVMSNGTPAVCVRGVPDLPVVVPGVADSPGNRICSRE